MMNSLRHFWPALFAFLTAALVFTGEGRAEERPEVLARMGIPGAETRISYTVDAEARNLSTISIRLYGTSRKWREIAEWNSIPHPYRISLGQKLTLKQAPLLSLEEGYTLLLAHYRKRFGLKVDQAHVDAILASARQRETRSSADRWVRTRTPAQGSEFLAAEKSFNAGRFLAAAESFRRIRTADPEDVPSWFYEIRSLQALDRPGESEEVARHFLGRFPEYKSIVTIRDGGEQK